MARFNGPKNPMRQNQILSGRDQLQSAFTNPVMQLTPEQKKLLDKHAAMRTAMERNGQEREEALKKVARDSYETGFADGTKATLNTVLAALALAANKLYGFGARRCLHLLNATAEEVFVHLDTAEAVQEVWDTIGLRFVPDNAFDQVEIVTEKPNNRLKKKRESMPKKELREDERSVIMYE